MVKILVESLQMMPGLAPNVGGNMGLVTAAVDVV